MTVRWWAAAALIAATALPASLTAAAPGLSVPAPAIPADAAIALSGELVQGGWARGAAPRGAIGVALDGKPVDVAADGSFLIGFDRDAPAQHLLAVRLADGRELVRSLGIAPRAWKIERVGVPMRPPTMPDEEFQRRRAAELARIAAARQVGAQSEGWQQRFIWPARGRLSGLFGSQRVYQGTPGAYHSGMDVAAITGTPFVAPADGVVILAAAAPFTIEGNLLMIDHGMGLNSAFLHCSEILVKQGDPVRQGQVIGRIGMTGRATGPHLHWSIKWRDARLDPLLFIGPAPLR